MSNPLPPLTTAAKAWAGFVIGVLMSEAAVVTGALADGSWSTGDTVAAGIAFIGAVGTGLGVYQVSNAPKV